MANRAYLLVCDEPLRYVKLSGDDVLCAASYMVPLFWYMLFEEEHVVRTSTPCDDDEPDYEYYRLERDRESALECARLRVPVVNAVIGEKIERLFNVWADFVASVDGKRIIVETCELSMMDEEALKFANEATRCTQAFSEPAIEKAGFLFRKQRANPKWAELLGQAEIELSGVRTESYKLCGNSYSRDVPWETCA